MVLVHSPCIQPLRSILLQQNLPRYYIHFLLCRFGLSFLLTVNSFSPTTTALLQYLSFRLHPRSAALLALFLNVGDLLFSMTEHEFYLCMFTAAETVCFSMDLKFGLVSHMLSGCRKLHTMNFLWYKYSPSKVFLRHVCFLFKEDGLIQWIKDHSHTKDDLLLLLLICTLLYVLMVTLFRFFPQHRP